MMNVPHVLILGGAGEARRLSERLVATSRLRVTLSLAGRTKSPLPQAGTVRTGGFGGADGLTVWLGENAVDIVVDATHPFAARISANAEAATRRTGVPLIVLERPVWRAIEGDVWIEAASIAESAALIGDKPKTAFLAIGRQDLAPFRAYPEHRYVVRSVDPVDPEDRMPNATYILDRGPFTEADEIRLLEEKRVDIVVAKNSGGDATYAKIAAARALALPVVMVRRPSERRADAATVEEALAKVLHLAALPAERGE
jgi:precorrin-6A/cobalt-precorrin-6A reductase